MNYLNNASFLVLQKSLDAVWMRQRVISNNIANKDTPGYKSKTVEFENVLKNVLERVENSNELANAVDRIKPNIKEIKSTALNPNGNNVDEDKENIELARAQIHYDYLVQALNSQIGRLKYAINGGN